MNNVKSFSSLREVKAGGKVEAFDFSRQPSGG